MNIPVRIAGLGFKVPETVITNDVVETSLPPIIEEEIEDDDEEGSNTILNIILIVLIIVLIAVLGLIIFYILKTKGVI